MLLGDHGYHLGRCKSADVKIAITAMLDQRPSQFIAILIDKLSHQFELKALIAALFRPFGSGFGLHQGFHIEGRQAGETVCLDPRSEITACHDPHLMASGFQAVC